MAGGCTQLNRITFAAVRSFASIRTPRATALSNSTTHPAIGNVDGVGASEIILGLGAGSTGSLEVVSGSAGSYSHQSWLQLRSGLRNR